ncbi:hypothetical protein PIB30_116121, partial [Stylosanthes scabra]|nr:hypothetical protein [Stylosanthes scabra]
GSLNPLQQIIQWKLGLKGGHCKAMVGFNAKIHESAEGFDVGGVCAEVSFDFLFFPLVGGIGVGGGVGLDGGGG